MGSRAAIRAVMVVAAFAAAVLAGPAVVVGMAANDGSSAAAATAAPFALSVTPTQNLVDGQSMTVTVTRTAAGTAAGLQLFEVAIGWCARGTSLPSALPPGTTPGRWNFPVLSGRLCTTATHRLNSDLLPSTPISPLPNTTGDYPTVAAAVAAQSSGGTPVRFGKLVCDAADPCTFAVAVWAKTRALRTAAGIYLLSTPVTYLTTAGAVAGCGGAAPGLLSSNSPDRLGRLYVDETLGACAAGVGGGRALSSDTSSAQGDRTAICAFAGGTADLAYAAVGYGTATSPFNPANCPNGAAPARPYVAVPVALNAVVMAHLQSRTAPTIANVSTLTDYPQLDITDAQAAQLLGGGPKGSTTWNGALGQALLAENPTLRNDAYGTSPGQDVTHPPGKPGATTGLVASSLPTATTLFATTFFHTVAPGAFMSATAVPRQLGPTADFATADPAFHVYPATGGANILKDLIPYQGLEWALVDRATASGLWGGLADFALQSPGSIGSASPAYVAPTPTAMDAAVSEMLPQADGTLLPNPDTVAANGVEPYPLTYVEYVLAPAQPLLNTDCTPRTRSQQDLLDWLDYLTGVGQVKLATVGMVPLTPALQAEARAAIAQVGATAPTGTCASAPTTGAGKGSTAPSTPSGLSGSSGLSGTGPPGGGATGPPTGSEGAAGAAGGTSGSSGRPLADVASRGTGPSARGATTGSTSPSPGGQHPAHDHGAASANPAVDLAGFRVAHGGGWGTTFVGVLVLLVLLPGLALLVSGRWRRWARRPDG
ncbi:MAG TPA: hypothetical protein VHB02_07280 [Acidimicrobiales bacterium]|nr:hypothetical protein [Acidimicrobiales bacterium]